MIIDLPRFIQTERPTWTELESLLDQLAAENTISASTRGIRFVIVHGAGAIVRLEGIPGRQTGKITGIVRSPKLVFAWSAMQGHQPLYL